ncbi:hypothetical protein NCH01_02280 [Neoasaia chiangmaiensis]|uniref:sulfotransferase family 2 domain-containing protein n=1 Tax=Neoasaia chiangmaiensis TaxID=320497 RepID=UPI001190A005|nr:sulfotransferase family 2 domain-containing protein [Neoasaia chiangmaiensis]GEN13797.1 hypothetical protein NCH01_02280 [Neoasaia chiangmaiensis]
MAAGCNDNTTDIILPARPSEAAQPPLHRLVESLCRVQLFSDIHERACDLGLRLPLGRKRQARIAKIYRTRTLFIHVPKNAGTSVNALLYGESMRHETARYFHHVQPAFDGPDFVRFAIWRDPVERFLSAFDFARRGGGRAVRLHPAFAAIYRQFRSLDDALDHVEQARSIYEMDHVFRPQSWYIRDRQNRVMVDKLVPFHGLNALPTLIPALDGKSIPHLNHSFRTSIQPGARQIARIRTIYAQDEALRDHLLPI